MVSAPMLLKELSPVLVPVNQLGCENTWYIKLVFESTSTIIITIHDKTCDEHSSLSPTIAVQIYELSCIYIYTSIQLCLLHCLVECGCISCFNVSGGFA